MSYRSFACVLLAPVISACTFYSNGIGESGSESGATSETSGTSMTMGTGSGTETTGPSPACGDGQLDAGEQCDSGEDNGPGKLCKADCTNNVCGDGDVGPGEGCDDGNADDDDGCTSMCVLLSCGNGTLDRGEECDEGNANGGDSCTMNCKLPSCGDGIKQAGEECDDANTVNEDACTNECTDAFCGDDIIHQEVEECDNGIANGDDKACTSMCLLATCGDGFIQDEVEECDDGEENNGEDKACTPDCQVNVCGDMYNGPEEECDDGNDVDTDECLNSCKLADCGDGVIFEGEEGCDDGNTENGDGCSADCEVEVRIIFVTSGAYKGNFGGLNGADGICQGLVVNNQNLNGEFSAWLSAGTESAAGRLEHANVSYVLLNGDVVADNWDDLVDGNIQNSISITEEGVSVGGTSAVWTGTNPGGGDVSPDCQGWMSKSGDDMGVSGKRDKTDDKWTENTERKCSIKSHIYCIQQGP